MKILIAAVILLLVVPSMAVERAEDVMYNAAMQSPSVGAARINMDASHIGVTITPGPYATDMQEAAAYIMAAGYYSVLLRMPNYNGYLRIGVAQNAKIVAIWEMGANEMRQANAAGGSNEVANLINDRVYNGGKSISYYRSDGWGDVTKPYGRLSPSVGNWL
jgi:hypothetical protein